MVFLFCTFLSLLPPERVRRPGDLGVHVVCRSPGSRYMLLKTLCISRGRVFFLVGRSLKTAVYQSIFFTLNEVSVSILCLCKEASAGQFCDGDIHLRDRSFSI